MKSFVKLNLFARMEYSINLQWDGRNTDHDEIFISLVATESGLKMSVSAPFFNDPPNPGTKPGEPLYGLWNYEGKVLTVVPHLITVAIF